MIRRIVSVLMAAVFMFGFSVNTASAYEIPPMAPITIAQDHGGSHINARHKYPRWVDCRVEKQYARSKPYLLGGPPLILKEARKVWGVKIDVCHNKRSELDWVDPIHLFSQVKMVDVDDHMMCAKRGGGDGRIQGVLNWFTWRNQDGKAYEHQNPEFSYSCYETLSEISEFQYFFLPERYFYDGRKQVWLGVKIHAFLTGKPEWKNSWAQIIRR
jgi:hypothetical protein